MSADALQVYSGLETLTGAAGPAEQARLEHRLISFLDPAETFSAGEFARRAHAEIDAALAAGRRPIVVGGTGLYLQAALTDLELRPPPDPAVRAALEERMRAEGPEALHAELAERDPEAAAGVEPRDRTRVLRALELLAAGERPAPAGGGVAPLDRAAAPPDAPVRSRRWSAARSTSASTPASNGSWPPARRARQAGRAGRRVAHSAGRARLRGAAERRRGGHEAPHPQLREAPAQLAAPLAGRTRDRARRAGPRACGGDDRPYTGRAARGGARPTERGSVKRSIAAAATAALLVFVPSAFAVRDYCAHRAQHHPVGAVRRRAAAPAGATARRGCTTGSRRCSTTLDAATCCASSSPSGSV